MSVRLSYRIRVVFAAGVVLSASLRHRLRRRAAAFRPPRLPRRPPDTSGFERSS